MTNLDSDLDIKYDQLCNLASDINEHLPTLYEYTKKCNSVLELGVRSAVSSFAFTKGLRDTNGINKRLISCDIQRISDSLNSVLIKKFCNDNNIEYTFILKNDLDIVIPDEVKIVDITFIDTWHIYGQLKRELKKFAPITTKYIILHDTELDKEFGETIRSNWDARSQSEATGIPIEEINRGLEPAISEFLRDNANWNMDYQVTNNNGLTVLKRIN
jgi:hypothetical protein